MIGLNRPRPFIFIGWEVLTYKERLTSWNLPKLLILLRLRVTRSDKPWEAVRPPDGVLLDRLQGTPSQTAWRTWSDRVAQPYMACANLDVNSWNTRAARGSSYVAKGMYFPRNTDTSVASTLLPATRMILCSTRRCRTCVGRLRG
jgi:hypothetical protein